MAGEMLVHFAHFDASEMYEAGKDGLIQTKTLVLSGLGLGAGIMARNAITKHKADVKPAGGKRRPHFIQQNHVGLRHRKGVYTDEIVRPNSWVYLLNPLKGYDQLNLRDKITPIKPLTVDSAEGRKHLIDASVTWGHIADDGHGNTGYDIPYHKIIEKGLTGARSEVELDDGVMNICRDGLRMILSGRQSSKLDIVDSVEVQQELVDLRGDMLLDRYGAEIRMLSIGNSSSANIPIDHYHPGSTDMPVEGEEQLGTAALGQLSSHPHLHGV